MPEKGLVRRGLITLGVVSLISITSSCKKEDTETIIRGAIESARVAAEKQDLGGLMKWVSPQIDAQGMKAKELKGYVFAQMRAGSWRKVFFVRTSVDVTDEENAEAKTTAVLARGTDVKSLEEALPKSAGAYEISMSWRKEDDGEWRIVKATWRRVTDTKSLLGL